MPEGDTIHRTAATLRHALVGGRLTRVELPRLAPPLPRPGATVTGIEARGKHLLVHTSDGLTLHTHQRMTGSWHLYRPGERWRKSPRAARAVLGVPGRVAVCFASPVVEVLATEALDRHPTLRRLGPDLCAPAPDLDAAVARARRELPDDRAIGEALLDQRVACGVGNVYRCDALFVHGLDPATPLAALDDAALRGLLAWCAQRLRENLDAARRTTVPGAAAGALWVHGRAGRPCRRCATPVEVVPLGDGARLAYRCPTCQPPHAWSQPPPPSADTPAAGRSDPGADAPDDAPRGSRGT